MVVQPERRRSLRVPDSRTIAVVAGEVTFEALLTNISTLGALVVAQSPAATTGKAVQLRFPVATGGKLVATAHILRVGTPAGTIALQFDRPLNEFPVEKAPVAAFEEPAPAKANPLAFGCVIALVSGAAVLTIGALILAFVK